MTNNDLLALLRHAFGVGIVGGVYTTQVVHINQYIGITPISAVYLFSLLSFYFLQYGYESKILQLPNAKNLWRVTFFKRSLIAANILVSVFEFFAHQPASTQSVFLFGLRGLFSVFGVVFPELVFPLIFDDAPSKRK